jgi:hypothetical protein
MKLKLLFPILLFLAVLLLENGCGSRSREEVDQIISNSEVLSRIDKVCQTLSRPTDFKEVKKGIYGNASHSSITYQYKMSGTFDSAVNHFKTECLKLNCKVVDEYDNPNDKGLQNLVLHMDGVNIEIEYRPEYKSLVNYGCSMK